MSYIDNSYIMRMSYKFDMFVKKKESLYNFRCPLCGDSQKNKVKSRGFIYLKKNNYFYMCHNCGASMTLKNFIKIVDKPLYDEYVMDLWKEGKSISNKKIKKEVAVKYDMDFSYKKVKSFNYDNVVKLSELDENHTALKYIKNRKITKLQSLYYSDDFKLMVDSILPNNTYSLIKNDPRIVIPFYDDKYNLIAIQGRSIGDSSIRYITIKVKDDSLKIYGMDTVDDTNMVYVLEGPLDSLFVDNSVAMAGSDCDLDIFKKFDDVGFIYDNEPRNIQIVKKMEKVIEHEYGVLIWPDEINEKDINDMIINGYTEEDLQKVISNNVKYGLSAKACLNQWKRC
jgi:transcription elongation factor Elf1